MFHEIDLPAKGKPLWKELPNMYNKMNNFFEQKFIPVGAKNVKHTFSNLRHAAVSMHLRFGRGDAEQAKCYVAFILFRFGHCFMNIDSFAGQFYS